MLSLSMLEKALNPDHVEIARFIKVGIRGPSLHTFSIVLHLWYAWYYARLSSSMSEKAAKDRRHGRLTLETLNDPRTTGSPGVIGSWMTFVRFGFKMKHRYLGTSDHTVEVDIDGF